MHENKKEPGKGKYFWFCVTNGQNTSIHNLMLSAISRDDKLLDEKYEEISKDFDKLYTVLMLTSSYDSSGFISQVADLAITIRDADSIEDIRNEFDKTIKTIIKKKRNRENINDIFAPSLYEKAGYSLGASFLRYFFGRIDHYLADEMQLSTPSFHGLIKQNQGNTVYHIEHILARNDENKSWFDSEDDFEEYRDRLGALVLLKGADNMSSGNESYKDKLLTYGNVGTLWSKTLIPTFTHSNKGFDFFCEKRDVQFETYDRYDAKAVKERFEILMKLIRQIWGEE